MGTAPGAGAGGGRWSCATPATFTGAERQARCCGQLGASQLLADVTGVSPPWWRCCSRDMLGIKGPGRAHCVRPLCPGQAGDVPWDRMCRGETCHSVPPSPPFLPAMGLTGIARCCSEAVTCTCARVPQGWGPPLLSPPAVPLLWPMTAGTTACGTGNGAGGGQASPVPGHLERAVPRSCWGPVVMRTRTRAVLPRKGFTVWFNILVDDAYFDKTI